MHRPLLFTAAGLIAASAAFIVPSGSIAAEQDTVGVRAISGNIFSVTSALMYSLPTFCIDQDNRGRDCDLAASGKITVSASTKRKYKLPSFTVAKGNLAPCGVMDCVKMKSTARVRSKLKGAKTLPVTITLSVSSPVQETMKKQATLRLTNTGRVIFQTSNIGGDEAVPGQRG